MMTDSNTTVRELNPGIFQIRDLNGSSQSYVIKGHHMNVKIDSGSDQTFQCWNASFSHRPESKRHQFSDQLS